jgi:hypothetical protein
VNVGTPKDIETHVKLGLRDLRTLVRPLCKGVVELERLGLFGEALEELIVDA